jgi:tellurite resistance protein TerC
MLSTIGTPWLWAGFTALVVVALVVDLMVLNAKGAKKVGFREALSWSLAWVALALAFNGWLWWYVDGAQGREAANRVAAEFFTGYLIEKSLAVDNIFVFLMLFTAFGVPAIYQRRVLVLGVIGAIVLRAVMILIGAWLLARFHWILYVFGAFLLLTGIKMLFFAEAEPDIEKNPVLKWLRRHVTITPTYHEERFVVVQDGRRAYTPLFVVMVMIAITDVIFAVDSIPAIFAVTLDPFIVLTSNVFAILGLRAMYFMLADLADRFHLLKYGLAFILVFIGIKMLLLDVYKIPIGFALVVVGAILAISMVGSLWVTRPGTKPGADRATER